MGEGVTHLVPRRSFAGRLAPSDVGESVKGAGKLEWCVDGRLCFLHGCTTLNGYQSRG